MFVAGKRAATYRATCCIHSGSLRWFAPHSSARSMASSRLCARLLSRSGRLTELFSPQTGIGTSTVVRPAVPASGRAEQLRPGPRALARPIGPDSDTLPPNNSVKPTPLRGAAYLRR